MLKLEQLQHCFEINLMYIRHGSILAIRCSDVNHRVVKIFNDGNE